jgi:hypothetical protein
MVNPDGMREPDSKLWYRAQALRRVATDLANSLKDTSPSRAKFRSALES